MHKPGASNPADCPSREPSSCLADSTGARLDYDLQDWPLPTVYKADLTPDTTEYTHDSLALDLGFSTSASAAAVSEFRFQPSAALALAAADGSPSLQALAGMVAQHTLYSNETALDACIPSVDSLLGGGKQVHWILSWFSMMQTQLHSINCTTCKPKPPAGWHQQPTCSSSSLSFCLTDPQDAHTCRIPHSRYAHGLLAAHSSRLHISMVWWCMNPVAVCVQV